MLLSIIVAGDAAVQAAVTLKPCSDVKNLPLDHFPNLLCMATTSRESCFCKSMIVNFTAPSVIKVDRKLITMKSESNGSNVVSATTSPG